MTHLIPDWMPINFKSAAQIFLPVLLAGMVLAPVQTTLAAPLRATISVNTTADENGTGGNCSLREAITAANTDAAFGGCPAGSGADTINVPAGTYTLTLANGGGTNEDSNATGDLDILNSLTIQGAGSAATIIRAGTNTSNGIDKVFALNPICTSVVNVTIDGVTIQYGRNTQPAGSPDFSNTGGGLDWCGVTTSTLNFTNSIVADNTNVNSYGGGMNIDSASSANNGAINISSVTFQNNRTIGTVSQVTGGAINIFGGASPVTITGSTFTGNLTTATTAAGGAIYFRPTNGMSLLIHNSDFNGNTSGGNGGGIYVNIPAVSASGAIVTIDQDTQIRNNVSGGVTGGSAGGSGLFLGGGVLTTTPMLVSKVTISGNSDGASAATHNGGGGIFVQEANATVQYSRIVNNSVSGGATGSGLYKSVDTGAVTATNNWWGCSTGPGASPCDTALIAGGSAGSLSTTTYFRVLTTPGSSSIVTNQTTSLLASVNTNSAGTSMATNVDRLLGLPVTWSAVNGTISGADAVIAASGGSQGTAGATFTATAAGTGKGIAKVDNDSTSGAGSNLASITINKANTTTAITSDSPDPSVTGQPVTVSYTVTGAFGNSPTAPTGNVTVSDGTDSCIGTVAAGSCAISFTSVGSKTITATYAGNSNFNPSAASTGVAHTVDKADTTTTITSDTPDPSVVGQSITFNYSVTVDAPGSGTPTGNVTVTDGAGNTCSATAAAGSCAITFTAPGSSSFTATYVGDANFNSSVSAGASHTVDKADTTTSITSDTPDPSVVGELVTFNFTVTVDAPGAGTPTGNVTVTDGSNTCIGTVATGSCQITFTAPSVASLTAAYAGDSNFNGSTSASASHTANKADTTATITSDDSDPSLVGQAVTVDFTVTIDSPGSGTLTGNVTVSDGVDSCIGTAASGTCDITLTTPGPRTLTAVYAGDSNFNGSTSAGASHTVTQPDTTVASILRDSATPTNAASVSWTVQFAGTDAISGLTSGNFTLVNIGLGVSPVISSVTPIGGSPANQWTVTASTGTGAGTLGLNLTSGTGLSHNVTNEPFTGQVYAIDHVAPDVTINQSLSQPDPTGVSPIDFTVVFNEAVSGFATGDVTLSGTAGATTGTVTEIAPNDGTTYNVAVNGMAGDGTVIATILAGKAQDTAGNNNNASTSTDNTVLYDAAVPSVTINQAGSQADPTNAGTINFTVVFSEAVTDFDDAGDVSLSGTAGATTSNITGGPTTYNVAVSGMSGNGTVTAAIGAGVATDLASKFNTASTSSDSTVTYDATGPTVTINQKTSAPAQADPTGSSPINFTVVFSEAASGFATGDVTLGGTAGATIGTVTGGPTTYNVAVSGMTGGGTVSASINAGVATDLAGNNNAASTSTDNTVTFTVNTTTTITSDNPDPSTVGQAVTVNFTVVASLGPNPTTGSVTVSDSGGAAPCVVLVTAGACNITLTSSGAHILTATYAGSGPFNGSSDTEAHSVSITLGVNTFADDLTNNGNCSLREAVRAANTNLAVDACPAGSAAIVDNITLATGTYTLSRSGIDDTAILGDLDITGNTKITGAGAASTFISGASLDRVFHVLSGTVQIDSLTVKNGNNALGGGIYNAGTLTLNSVTVTANAATTGAAGTSRGAGIYNTGTLTLNTSTVSSNTATTGAAGKAQGGGIYNGGGTVTLNSSTVTGNKASSGALGTSQGGGIYTTGGSTTLNSTTPSGNTVTTGAGGVAQGPNTYP